MKKTKSTPKENTWYFIASGNSFAVAFANSPEEAIKEIPGDKRIKKAYLLEDFYLYKEFLHYDKQFHCDLPDMSDPEDRHLFLAFCAGHFLNKRVDSVVAEDFIGMLREVK